MFSLKFLLASSQNDAAAKEVTLLNLHGRWIGDLNDVVIIIL